MFFPRGGGGDGWSVPESHGIVYGSKPQDRRRWIERTIGSVLHLHDMLESLILYISHAIQRATIGLTILGSRDHNLFRHLYRAHVFLSFFLSLGWMEHTRIFPAATTPLVGGHVIFLTNHFAVLVAIGANLICDMIVAQVRTTAVANVKNLDSHFLSLSFFL